MCCSMLWTVIFTRLLCAICESRAACLRNLLLQQWDVLCKFNIRKTLHSISSY